jgi:hypothetical protein
MDGFGWSFYKRPWSIIVLSLFFGIEHSTAIKLLIDTLISVITFKIQGTKSMQTYRLTTICLIATKIPKAILYNIKYNIRHPLKVLSLSILNI